MYKQWKANIHWTQVYTNSFYHEVAHAISIHVYTFESRGDMYNFVNTHTWKKSVKSFGTWNNRYIAVLTWSDQIRKMSVSEKSQTQQYTRWDESNVGCHRNLSVSPSSLATVRTAQYGRLERKYKPISLHSLVISKFWWKV